MGERRIDHDRVKVMSRLFPQKVVAERMNISPRSVRRIVSPTSSGHSAPSLPSPDEEFFMMKMYREDFGLSYGEIGRRMGKTRQAVQQKLDSEKAKVKGEKAITDCKDFTDFEEVAE